jgi:hypothetical protein
MRETPLLLQLSHLLQINHSKAPQIHLYQTQSISPDFLIESSFVISLQEWANAVAPMTRSTGSLGYAGENSIVRSAIAPVTGRIVKVLSTSPKNADKEVRTPTLPPEIIRASSNKVISEIATKPSCRSLWIAFVAAAERNSGASASQITT